MSMRKFIFIMMLFVFIITNAQPKMFDFTQYSNVDSLSIEMVYFHTDAELTGDTFINLEGGYYMAKTPFTSHFIIKTNADRTLHKQIAESAVNVAYEMLKKIDNEYR